MNQYLKQIKEATLLQKLLLIIGFLLAMALPLYAKATSILIYVFIGLVILTHGKTAFNKKITSDIPWLSTTLILYLIPIIAFAFSASFYDSIKAAGKYLLYLLVPIVLYFLETKERRLFIESVKKGLVVGAVIATLIMLVNQYIRTYTNPEPFQLKTILNFYHTYYYYTSIIRKHPTYIGAEIYLAVVFLYQYTIKTQRAAFKTLGAVFILLMSLSLLFINSRVIFILFITSILFILLRYVIRLVKTKQFTRFGRVILGTFLVVFIVYKMVSKTYFFDRYTKELSWELRDEVGTSFNTTSTSDSRVARWNSALKLIQKKWIRGHGNSSEKRELYEQYEEDGLVYAMERRYDAHNIYIAYLVEYGIWGVGLLLLFISHNFVRAYKQRSLNSFFLILMIVFIGISENYLKTSEGILLTAIFVNLMAFKEVNSLSEATL